MDKGTKCKAKNQARGKRGQRSPTPRPFADDGPVEVLVACDTEFEGPHTLTVQFAARVSRRVVAVQVYHSPALGLPAIELEEVLPRRLLRLCGTVLMRPMRPITNKLSPARVLADLYGLGDAEVVSRSDGWHERHDGETGKPIRLTLAAHHLAADFARTFGSGFYRDLMTSQGENLPRLIIQ